MSLKLINELNSEVELFKLFESHHLFEGASILKESIDKYLGTIFAKFKNMPNPFDGQDALDLEETAAIITGLKLLGKSEHREAYDLGTGPVLLKFLSDIGENTMDGKKTVDKVIEIGKAARSDFSKNLEQFKKFNELEEKDKNDIRNNISRLSMFYQNALNTLKTKFKPQASQQKVLPDIK